MGIEITIGADKSHHLASRVNGYVDQLSWRAISEPLQPDCKPICFDAAVQEFRCQNVGIGVTPTRSMNRCDRGCVCLGSGSNDDASQDAVPCLQRRALSVYYRRIESRPIDSDWVAVAGYMVAMIGRLRVHLRPSRRTAADSGSAFNRGRTGRVCRGMARRTRGAARALLSRLEPHSP